ncbi:hypothetical protein OF83DRAFT_1121448 [Amylostereum chailletii]|nr:hypothetical protein OF83DRAFT_1121448 [Amylostereum chailletii]
MWFHYPADVSDCASIWYDLLLDLNAAATSVHDALQDAARSLAVECGGATLLARFYRDLDDNECIGDGLTRCVRAITAFEGLKTVVRTSGAQVELCSRLSKAYLRQTMHGIPPDTQHLWELIFDLFRLLLDDPSKRAVRDMLEIIVPLLNRGVLISAVITLKNTRTCAEVVRDMTALASTYKDVRRGEGKRIYATLRRCAKEEWYPTVRYLRAAIGRNPLLQSLRSLSKTWSTFCAALGFSEERARSRTFCGWKECEYHDSKSPSQRMRLCRKCRRVCYCDKKCQRQDWKNGHKVACGGHEKMNATKF